MSKELPKWLYDRSLEHALSVKEDDDHRYNMLQIEEAYIAGARLVLAALEEAVGALEKCHEELVGHIGHEGGDLETALTMADAALSRLNALIGEAK